MKWLATARTAAREEMDVDVIDHLPALRPAEALRREQAAAERLGVRALHRHHRRDVALRDDQDVHRGLRVDVLEGEHRVVLVLDVRGLLARDDAAKDAVGHRLPPRRPCYNSRAPNRNPKGAPRWARAPSASARSGRTVIT